MRASLMLASVLALALPLCGPAQAGSYPDAPVKLVVPFPPGGSSDMLARLVGSKLGTALGQPIIIDNRGGGGTAIATAMAARARPDGYTLLWVTTPAAVNVTLRNKLPYDIVRDFAPVVTVASLPLVVMVKPSLPIHSVQELVAYAKAHPGKLNFGSSGMGGTPHLAGEMLKSQAGINMVHVPYQGSGPLLNASMAGEVDVVVEAVQSFLPVVQAGKLRALATTGHVRSALFPDLPTMEEAGYPQYHTSTWFAMSAPAGTPADVVGLVNQDVVKVLAQPNVKQQLEGMGFQIVADTPAAAGDYLRGEIAKWKPIVTATGLHED